MKLKTLLINLLLTLSSIYIPLLAFSTYDYYSSRNESIRIRHKLFLNIIIPETISAVNSGFLPVYYPGTILKNKNLPNIYPIGSLPFQRTYLCNEGYGLITYTSDRFGFRNLDSKWQNIYKKSNIYVIGDSFVQGECVPDNSTITSNVERSIKLNTINLGMGNNGPYEYLAILKSIVKPLIRNTKKENKVVLVFFSNDNLPSNIKKESLLYSLDPVIDNKRERDVYPSINYTRNLRDFINMNYPYIPSKFIFIRRMSRLKYTSFYQILTLNPIVSLIKLQIINNNSSSVSSSDLASRGELRTPSQRAISMLSETCKNYCKPYVAYIPNSLFWTPNFPPSIINKYKSELKNMSEKSGITFIDGEDVIDKNNLKDYAPKGGHLSKFGYKKIADLISNKIKN